MKFKMKKIYIPLIAGLALGFSACSNEDDPIFSSSAAERLEQSRNEYKDVLTADGGLWSIEYFTNTDEPGYVLLMKFGKNGAVEVSADHQWIGNRFRQETSLWDIISDNGTVLTFNSYNTLFHVFSTPEDITGPNAPTNDDGDDINELGYGHEGDYEFLLMNHKGGNVELVGKKHGMTAWLRKLPADTNPEEFLKAIRARRSVFSAKFPEFLLTEADGHTYTVTDMGSGIPSIYPRDFNGVEADPVTQTVSAHGIMTSAGFRFREPLTVKRADDSTWELTELLWQEDGTLASADGAVITGPTAQDALSRISLTWILDKESLTGKYATAFEAANNALIAYSAAVGGYKDIVLSYTTLKGQRTPWITFNVGSRVCRDYVNFDYSAPDAVTLSLLQSTDASKRYDTLVPEYKAFKDILMNSFSLERVSALDPSTITFVDADGDSFSFNVQ